MSLFNQVLALPASEEPRTVSSRQLCQNTALKTRKPQTSLEQQTSSALILQVPAAASSLPQLREGKEMQLPSKTV